MKTFRFFSFFFRTGILFLLVLAAGKVSAQTGERPARPRVGLALSGGAAKGFAHIGVLRVLEEAGIYPDYITGTSMGSIMGGLYALGYRPDTLAALSRAQDWNLVLSDQVPLYEVNMEEKLFFRNYLLEFPFRKGRLEAPSGLVHGQQIEELLSRLTLPAYYINDFDSLPIPFRCMASDVVSGRPIEISGGSLSRAMRASMAIPTIFTPVEQDSMLLVDGGLIRNFPVREVKEMGADVVIGVYVGYQSQDSEKLRNFGRILTQIAFLTSVQDAQEQMGDIDLYIQPDLGTFGPADFLRADTIIALGEKAAREKMEDLQRLADSLNAFGPPPLRTALPAVGRVRIDQMRIIGNHMLSNAEVAGWAGLYPGQEVTPLDLLAATENLYGTNYYEKVTYSLRREGDENILLFNCVEKAPTLLKGSLIYDSYHEAGLAFNLTLRNALLPASRLMLVGRFADNFRYRLSYLKYLGRQQRWFTEFLAQINRDAVPIIRDGRTFEEYRLGESPLELWLRRRAGKNVLLGIGAQLENLSLQPQISADPIFTRLRYRNFNLLASLQVNTQDRNILPSRGTQLLFELKYLQNLDYSVEGLQTLPQNSDSLFAFSSYPKLTFQSNHLLPLGRRNSLRLGPFAGILWNPESTFSDFFLMGAPEPITRRSIPFFGFAPNEMVVQVALGSNFGYQHFLRDNLMVALDFNMAFLGEPDLLEPGAPVPDLFAAGLGLTAGYNSLLGPVKFTLMLPLGDDLPVQQKWKGFLTYGHRF